MEQTPFGFTCTETIICKYQMMSMFLCLHFLSYKHFAVDGQQVHIHILYTAGSLLHAGLFTWVTVRCRVMRGEVSTLVEFLGANLMTVAYGAHHLTEI